MNSLGRKEIIDLRAVKQSDKESKAIIISSKKYLRRSML